MPITVTILLNKKTEFDAAVMNYVEQAVAENNEIFGLENQEV